ncbi:hypothetical protein ACERII_01100 [Evansella sp. AB-rgal1]|uniref:hypothetical protein n=1 Tax=Evansella sp. AB-rgal1 TaxID=3242696 RepID=UPI00359DE922
MLLLNLFLSLLFGFIGLYHFLTHMNRKKMDEEVIFVLDDSRKTTTKSLSYKISIYCSVAVMLMSLILFIQTFRSIEGTLSLLIMVVLLGTYVLYILDKVFEVREDTITFSGYHVNWGRVKHMKWGKQRKNDRKMIMIVRKGKGKGVQVEAWIPNDQVEELEELLSMYVEIK